MSVSPGWDGVTNAQILDNGITLVDAVLAALRGGGNPHDYIGPLKRHVSALRELRERNRGVSDRKKRDKDQLDITCERLRIANEAILTLADATEGIANALARFEGRVIPSPARLAWETSLRRSVNEARRIANAHRIAEAGR